MSFDQDRYLCTSCGAPVSFRAGASVFAVCPYCKATLLRKGASLETLGTMAELAQDISVLQLGTTGRIPQGSFSLIGRLTLTWTKGTWNEWYLLLDSGKAGWLAESQGWYAVSFEQDASGIDESQLAVGNRVEVAGESFQVNDRKEAICTFSEGELPFSGAKGETYLVFDCAGQNNSFASFGRVGDTLSAYVGRYYTFDELKLAQVRVLDGW